MKSKLNTMIAVGALSLGFVCSLANEEWFTAYTLVETILLVASLLYLIFKYTSRTILLYQPPNYSPSKTSKLVHNVFNQLGSLFVQPICLDFIYACLILFVIKMIDPARLNILGNTIFWIWKFNSEHISSPLKILVLVLSCLTLIHILPEKHFKKVKSAINYFKSPLKIIAILVLFLNIDKGSVSKTLIWKLNTEVQEFKIGDKLTFNATEQKNIREMIKAYTDVMMREVLRLDTNKISLPTDSLSPAAFYRLLEKNLEYHRKEPTIKTDLLSGKGFSTSLERNSISSYPNRHKDQYGHPDFSDGDIQKINSFYDNSTGLHSDVISAPHNLPEYSRELAASPTQVRSFLDILKDDGPVLNEKKTSANQEILKDIIGDFLEESILFERLQNSIAFYSFAKDKAFDLLKDKMVSGLFYLVKKAKNHALQHSDVRFVTESIKGSFKYHMGTVIEKIAEAKQLLTDFSYDYRVATLFKNRFSGNKAKISSEDWQQYLDLFPNDPNYYYNKNIRLIATSQSDENMLKNVDIEYLKKHGEQIKDPIARAEWGKKILQVEEEKDFVLTKGSYKSDDWVRLAQKWPNKAKEKAVQDKIKELKINEDVDDQLAANQKHTIDAWKEYITKHSDSPLKSSIELSIYYGKPYELPQEIVDKLRPPFHPPVIVEKKAGIWIDDFMRFMEHFRP